MKVRLKYYNSEFPYREQELGPFESVRLTYNELWVNEETLIAYFACDDNRWFLERDNELEWTDIEIVGE